MLLLQELLQSVLVLLVQPALAAVAAVAAPAAALEALEAAVEVEDPEDLVVAEEMAALAAALVEAVVTVVTAAVTAEATAVEASLLARPYPQAQALDWRLASWLEFLPLVGLLPLRCNLMRHD